MSGRTPDEAVPFAVNLQAWERLTFLHWAYDPDAVRRLVPDGLTVQTWDGVTWVAVTPFRMARVRVPGLPAPPAWRAFPELNVRAYVRAPDGRDGIWFLGMVVPRPTFIVALRALGLPYSRSRAALSATDDRWTYRFGTPAATRPPRDDWFHATVRVGGALPPARRTPLVDSLTGRWSAYHRRVGVLWRTPVTHAPWPLHDATATGDLTRPLRWAGLPVPDGDPLVHAAPAVSTRLGPPRPATR